MKIDTSKIPGYADMTAEEKIAALEAYEAKDDSEEEKKKLKAALDNATNEAATFKKKWKDTMDAEAKAKLEKEEELKRLRDENEEFKAERRKASYTAKYMGAGYDEATAKKLAEQLPEGIDDSFFETQKTFLQTQKQQAGIDKINNMPKPTPGMPMAANNFNDDFQKKLERWSGLK